MIVKLIQNLEIKMESQINSLEARIEKMQERFKRNEDNLRDLQDNIKCYNIRIIGVPEEED